MKHKIKYVIQSLIVISYAFVLGCAFLSNLSTPIYSYVLTPYFDYATKTIFMESFGFFSKDPKDFEYEFYQVKENNGDISLRDISLRNMEKYNNYGLSRINRHRLLKLSKLDKEVKNKWKTTIRTSIPKNLSTIDTIPINKTEYGFDNYAAGKYIIIKAKPTEWVWNNYSTKDSIEYALFEFY